MPEAMRYGIVFKRAPKYVHIVAEIACKKASDCVFTPLRSQLAAFLFVPSRTGKPAILRLFPEATFNTIQNLQYFGHF